LCFFQQVPSGLLLDQASGEVSGACVAEFEDVSIAITCHTADGGVARTQLRFSCRYRHQHPDLGQSGRENMVEAHTFPAATYSSVVKDNHLEDKRLPVFSLAGVHSRSCSSTANFERDLHYSKNADTCAKLENSEEYRLSRVIPVLRVATVNVNGAELLQKSQVSAQLCTCIYVYVLHWAKLNKIE
jgi:hypothetical protein